MRDTIITINKNHLQNNLSTIKRHTNARVVAMVKADAYGHGIKNIIPYIRPDAFGVACFEEAILVQKLCNLSDSINKNTPILLIEGVFSQIQWQNARQYDFMCVVANHAQLQYCLDDNLYNNNYDANTKNTHHNKNIWLKFNSGMNRLGFNEQDIYLAAQKLIEKGFNIILTSHFACADDVNHHLNKIQIAQFKKVRANLKEAYGEKISSSLCNSAGLFAFEDCHFDWVRIGIALYGAGFDIKTKMALKLLPVMRFCAKIITAYAVLAGQSIGYGASFIPKKDMRLAIVSVGYGDGYPRNIKNGSVCVIHNGAQVCCPIVGRVAMDLLSIDISNTDCAVGDEVILWGVPMCDIDDVAAASDTISYELLCKTTHRPKRMVI